MYNGYEHWISMSRFSLSIKNENKSHNIHQEPAKPGIAITADDGMHSNSISITPCCYNVKQTEYIQDLTALTSYIQVHGFCSIGSD